MEDGDATTLLTEPCKDPPDQPFDEYDKVSLTYLSSGPQLQYGAYVNLLPMIVRVAEHEGPVHEELIIGRIRGASTIFLWF